MTALPTAWPCTAFRPRVVRGFSNSFAFYRLGRFAIGLTILLVSPLSIGTTWAQTTDYLYGIEQGGTPELDVMAISVNAGGTATSFVNTQVTDLSHVAGFNALPGGSQNVIYNGLAIDPSNNTLFFTVSYNNMGDPTQGTFTATTYAVQNLWGTWHATQIFNLTQASGLADNPGVNNTAATPASSSVADGWFTKGAFYQGSYWVGVDQDVKSGTQNSIYQITLGNGDTSASTSQSIYSNVSHGGVDASRGGDMVFDNAGNIYFMGIDKAQTTGTFAKQSLANAIMPNDNGSNTWDQNTSLTLLYQLGGLGQGPQRLYATDQNNHLYQVTNFTDPAASAPIFTMISAGGGSHNTSFADLADSLLSAPIVPEPKMWIAGAFPVLLSIVDLLRRCAANGRKVKRHNG